MYIEFLEKRWAKGAFLLLVALIIGVLALGPTLVACAQAWFDDFNRPDGPLGSNWTVHAGSAFIQSQEAQISGVGLTTYNGATGSVAQMDVTADGITNTQYTALILNYQPGDLNNIFIKVQAINANHFTNYGCYSGNNANIGWGNGGFHPLDAQFESAHMRVEQVGNIVHIDFTNVDGGAQPDQHYVCSDPPAAPGNGVGLAGYAGRARMDNWCAGAGCDVGILDGHVYDASTLDPIEMARVTADGQYDHSDASGYYEFTLDIGTHPATATHPLYSDAFANVDILPDTTTTQDWYLMPRGYLFGHLSDVETGEPVWGAVDIAGWGTVHADSTGYYTICLDAGNYDLWAHHPYYLTETASVSIASGQPTQQDFPLLRALAFEPEPIHVTLDWQSTTSLPITISNRLTVPYDFYFAETYRSFFPAQPTAGFLLPSDGNYPHGDAPDSAGPVPIKDKEPPTGSTFIAPLSHIMGTRVYATEQRNHFHTQFDLGVPQVLPNRAFFDPGDFPGAGEYVNGYVYIANNLYQLDPDTGDVLSTIPITPPPAGETYSGMALDPTSGVLYASSTNVGTSSLFSLDVETGIATLIGPISGSGCNIAIAIDGAGQMYGHDICSDDFWAIDKATGTGTMIGPIGFDANFGQGMAWDQVTDQIYLAAFNGGEFRGELRIADRATGNTALVGVLGLGAAHPGGTCQLPWLGIPTRAQADVPWLGESPIAGALPASDSLGVSLLFSATYAASVNQPGDYHAILHLGGSLNPETPITMTVLPPADLGQVEGHVLDGCTGLPIRAAITITNGDPITESMSYPNGHYAVWLISGTFDLSFAAPGYLTYNDQVTIIPGQGITLDVNLAPDDRACIAVEPDAFEVWLLEGTPVHTHPVGLNVSNNGDQPLDFELFELEGSAQACLVAVTPDNGLGPNEIIELHNTLDELGLVWIDVTTVQEARDAGANVLIDRYGGDSTLVPLIDLQAWVNDGFGFVQLGDWPDWFSDSFESQPSGTPLNISVADAGHPLAAGLPSAWVGLGFWAYDWVSNAVSWVDNVAYPNVIQAQYAAPHERVVSFEEYGAGRSVYIGINTYGALATAPDKRVLENAIEWSGNCRSLSDVHWFWEEPISGTVPPAYAIMGSNHVDMMFTALYTDASPMPLGTYTATLWISSNNTITENTRLSVTMHIFENFISPTAGFESNWPICLGEWAIFTNTTTPGIPPDTDYLWRFGDGISDTLEHPTHLYAADGVYTVSLEACNLGACNTYQDNFEVMPLPAANFDYTANQLQVTFNNLSSNAHTYLWDLGDSQTSSDTHPVHVYAAEGDYTVTLWITGACGTDSFSDTLVVSLIPITYTLSTNVAPLNSGIVTIDPDQAYYDQGDVVTVTATPASAAWAFLHWTGAPIGSSTSPSETITMSDNYAITAVFSPTGIIVPTYTLSTNIAPLNSGIINVDPDQSYYDEGVEVTLSATPASAAWQFLRWLGDPINSSTNLTETITMSDDYAITAVFSPTGIIVPTYTLTTNVAPLNSGIINVDPDQSYYDEGVEVTLSATPASAAWAFLHWLGEPISGSANAIETLTMTNDFDLTAMFSPTGICVELDGVELSLITTGNIYTSTLAQFSADISPVGFSTPFSYTVNYGDGTTTDNGQSSADPLDLQHTFVVTGDLTVQIGVWNCDMSGYITDTLQVTVVSSEPGAYTLYLPIIIKND